MSKPAIVNKVVAFDEVVVLVIVHCDASRRCGANGRKRRKSMRPYLKNARCSARYNFARL